MSQPCALLELLLVDARDTTDEVVRAMLRLAVERALPHGSVVAGGANGVALDAAEDLLDFWLTGEPRQWPFARATRFAGVEAERTLFVSQDAAARQQAVDAGLMASAPDLDVMERLLP